MNCDVCGNEGQGAHLSARQVRAAVKAGFNPFTLGIVSKDVEKVVGRDKRAAFEAWTLVVFGNDTAWNLCARCETLIQPFALLKDAADAPEPIPEDAFDRADWLVKELRKRQAPAKPPEVGGYQQYTSGEIYGLIIFVIVVVALYKACHH